MAAAFGVHLGASGSCLSVCKEGHVEVIANAAGDRVTPSLVAFSDHDKVVGLPAKQGLIRNAKNTVCHVKRLLGRKFSDVEVQKEKQVSQCTIIEKDGKPYYQVQYLESQKLFSPDQCTTFIFETLRDIAKHHGDTDIHDVVISVPYCFTEQQHNSLKDAAETAGFNVIQLIHEPTAALLAYDQSDRHHRDCFNAVVVRIGGSSSTVSTFAVVDGMYKLLSDVPTDELGGDMFTQLIAEHFAKDFLRQYKMDPKDNRRSWSKLLGAAETCKHTITNLPNAHCSVDSLHDGIDFSANIARGRMDMMCLPLLNKLKDLLDESLTAAGLSTDQIDKVILSGGGTKPQCVVKKVSDLLPNAQLLNNMATDEVIAVGAAKQAGIILTGGTDKNVEPTAHIPALSQPISVHAQGSSSTVIFSASQPVPARVRRNYPATQSTFKMVITQGEEHTDILAKVALKDVKEGADIEILFSLDSEGALRVSCKEEDSKAHTELIVPSIANRSPDHVMS